MSLINDMLLDLNQRNYPFAGTICDAQYGLDPTNKISDNPIVPRVWPIRYKSVALIVLLAGLVFGGTALNQPAQTPNKTSLKKAIAVESQQPAVSVNSTLNADIYADKKESNNTTVFPSSRQ